MPRILHAGRLPLLALVFATAASAQPSNWVLRSAGPSVALAADRPIFGEGNPYGGVTSAWNVSASVPVRPGLRVVGEVPFAFADVETRSETSAALGNVQLVVEADLLVAPVTLGGYVRLPTASGSGANGAAQFAGLFAEYERIGTYVEDVATVSGLIEGRFSPASAPGLTLRLRVLPQVLIPTGDSNALFTVGDPEVYVGLAAQAIYAADQLLVGGGVTSLTLLTEGGGDRTEILVGVSAEFDAGRVRPGLTLRAPVSDGLDDVLRSVVGLRLSVGL